MNKLIQSILIVLICLGSVLPSTTQQPAPAESQRVQQVADLFVKRLEETSDLSQLFAELYASDFIERYIMQQRKSTTKGEAAQTIFFAPGLQYNSKLLEQATPGDWKRLYVATYNFLHYGLVKGMNRAAKDLFSGKLPSEKIAENFYPPKLVKFLDQHPILKNFIKMKERRPIETLEEMQSVITTLEQAMAFLRTKEAKKSYQLTDDSKKLMRLLKAALIEETRMEVTDEEFFGYPPGTRVFYVPTPFMLVLLVVNTDSKYRIVWTELGPTK